MSERKWTPGPWVYVADDCNGEFFGCGVAQHKDAPEFIWFDNCIDVETDIATAHLIAAAPEMYEALKHAAKNIPHPDQMIDAAISKAEGQQ